RTGEDSPRIGPREAGGMPGSGRLPRPRHDVVRARALRAAAPRDLDRMETTVRAARSTGRARARGWTATGALLALTAVGLTACSADVPDARPAAEALAASLETGDFTAVPFAPDAPAPDALAE